MGGFVGHFNRLSLFQGCAVLTEQEEAGLRALTVTLSHPPSFTSTLSSLSCKQCRNKCESEKSSKEAR
jgi:hypothetical protein